ncbi:MAG: peptidoglycan editing factor PgeF [Pseudomonadota bacterium]
MEFLAADWPAPPGVIAGTTLRTGGVSEGVYRSLNLGAHVDDSAEHVARNRERMLQTFELPGEPHWLQQVHGDVVRRLPEESEEARGGAADAAYTTARDTICAVLTADCLPVLFAAKDGSAVAAAHAGWRGLAAGVLSATVAAMPCAPSSLLAWLGPAISQRAFEVGDEVLEHFVAQQPDARRHFQANVRGRFQADLYGLARDALQRHGVTAVYGGDRCTFAENTAFFSYRRDGSCGRMASFVFRQSATIVENA